MPVCVADRVRAEVFGDFSKQQLALGIAPRPSDAGRGVDEDFARLVDEAELRQRDQREERRGRITAGIGHEIGGGQFGTGEFRESVHRIRRKPEIG